MLVPNNDQNETDTCDPASEQEKGLLFGPVGHSNTNNALKQNVYRSTMPEQGVYQMQTFDPTVARLQYSLALVLMLFGSMVRASE